MKMKNFHRARRRVAWSSVFVWSLVGLTFVMAAYYLSQRLHQTGFTLDNTASTARAGDLIAVDSVTSFTPSSAAALSHQNYGAATPPITTGVQKIIFHYRSRTTGGGWITVYGRAYLPDNPASQLPVFAFAPGTTGIGDQCAASLEVPSKANWANYDSHLVTYASQGMAVVTTDYEGMRDTSRIHHYMIGELEGRALLDAVRALRNLPQAKDRLNTGQLFLGGYSQGGHAAFWADKIAGDYAPDLRVKGVVGFGPVMSVKSTLADVTRGANINWFGPYVLYSYYDYYHTAYPVSQMLVPLVAQRLNADVPAHCIDTDIAHWGRSAAGVYTADFLKALTDNTWEGTPYAELGRQLDLNVVGSDPTASAKRINIGALDNVVLPSQQIAGAQQLCASSSGQVQQVMYQKATHYDTMLQSFTDTVNWMRAVTAGSLPGGCQTTTVGPTPTPAPPSPTPTPAPLPLETPLL